MVFECRHRVRQTCQYSFGIVLTLGCAIGVRSRSRNISNRPRLFEHVEIETLQYAFSFVALVGGGAIGVRSINQITSLEI